MLCVVLLTVLRPRTTLSCLSILWTQSLFIFFFFNDTATTEIYTLSLHDALPILQTWTCMVCLPHRRMWTNSSMTPRDRKSTRLNSSHLVISYAVFCLKKKKKNDQQTYMTFSRKRII